MNFPVCPLTYEHKNLEFLQEKFTHSQQTGVQGLTEGVRCLWILAEG